MLQMHPVVKKKELSAIFVLISLLRLFRRFARRPPARRGLAFRSHFRNDPAEYSHSRCCESYTESERAVKRRENTIIAIVRSCQAERRQADVYGALCHGCREIYPNIFFLRGGTIRRL